MYVYMAGSLSRAGLVDINDAVGWGGLVDIGSGIEDKGGDGGWREGEWRGRRKGRFTERERGGQSDGMGWVLELGRVRLGEIMSLQIGG